jgi:hypothetical protein
MKKFLTLAAILAAFALAQAPAFAAETAPVVKAEKTAAKHGLKKDEECVKEASVEKDGKKPSKKEVSAAYKACVKAKAASMKDAPKTEESK